MNYIGNYIYLNPLGLTVWKESCLNTTRQSLLKVV